MSIYSFITNHTFGIAIIMILVILVWQFIPKGSKASENKSVDKPDDKPKEDSTLDRMKRGFKVMGEKIKESDYVKGIKEEQKLADDGKLDDMMPKGIGESVGDDFFNTDLTKIGKTDL